MLGILCGLESEAAIARRIPTALVACAGARPQKARWLARELIKQGATKFLSFGVAGALEPDLPTGSLVIGSQVVSLDGTWECDKAWAGVLMQQLPAAHCGGVWGSEILIPTANDKRGLYARSRCLIVDMESQCAAQIAAEAKIPFAVLRAVCDNAQMGVPPMVMAAIREDGSTDKVRALWSLVRKPTQIPGLIHMGRGIGRALKALRASAGALKD